MNEQESRFRTVKDLPSTHLLGTGTPMCAGCGGLQALHQIYDVLGRRSVFINAAGCWHEAGAASTDRRPRVHSTLAAAACRQSRLSSPPRRFALWI